MRENAYQLGRGKKNDTRKSAEAPFSCAEVQLNYLAMKILFVAQPICC